MASDEKREVLTKISQIIIIKKKHGDDVESSPVPGDVFRPPPNASF